MIGVPQPPTWLAWLTYKRVGMIVGGAAAIGLGVYALTRAPGRGGPIHPFMGRDDWWRQHRAQPQLLCYRTKSAALQAFRDANRTIIEEWGGLDREDSPAEYDAVNHRHGLKGKRAVRSLSAALWVSMPSHPPYCLDQLDLMALNDTSPGHIGSGFRLPDWTHEIAHRKGERQRHRGERVARREDRDQARRDRKLLPSAPF